MEAWRIILSFVVDLLITAVAYLLVPVILILRKKVRSDKANRCIAIINAVVVALLFTVLHFVTGQGTPNYFATMIWGGLGWFLLDRFC